MYLARCRNRQKFDKNVIQHLQDNNKMESNGYEILNSPKESMVCNKRLDNSSELPGMETDGKQSPKSLRTTVI